MSKFMTLEESGLTIQLLSGDRVIVTYAACTHDGWTKYIGEPIQSSVPMEHFENKSDIILDANVVTKYYNCGLIVLI